MNIDTLTPAELREQCALAVGWKIVGDPIHDLWEKDGQYSESGGHPYHAHLPRYPEDPAAALQLVEIMRERGYAFQARIHFSDDPIWSVQFGWMDSVLAPTLPLAICRAFLKAHESTK